MSAAGSQVGDVVILAADGSEEATKALQCKASVSLLYIN